MKYLALIGVIIFGLLVSTAHSQSQEGYMPYVVHKEEVNGNWTIYKMNDHGCEIYIVAGGYGMAVATGRGCK